MVEYDLATKLIVAVLLLLVVHDQLTAPSADPRNEPAVPSNLNAAFGSGSQLDQYRSQQLERYRGVALEEATLLQNLTQRSLPSAEANLRQAAAVLAQVRALAAAPAPAESHPEGISAEAAAIARRSAGNPNEEAEAACQPTLHAGFNGGSLNWGMTFKVETAQQCCNACRAHAKTCVDPAMAGQVYMTRTWEGKEIQERCQATMSSNEAGTHKAQPCNVFVFCPTRLSEGGLCWSNDVWNHSYGECWLKNQRDPSRPEAGAYGAYPDGYRKKHHTAPARVQWMSGSLAKAKLTVDGPKWHW